VIAQDYIISLTILASVRFLDMFSTWLASPSMTAELNPIVRKLGWNGWLWANIAICTIAALHNDFFLALTFLSCIAAGWNFWIWARYR